MGFGVCNRGRVTSPDMAQCWMPKDLLHESKVEESTVVRFDVTGAPLHSRLPAGLVSPRGSMLPPGAVAPPSSAPPPTTLLPPGAIPPPGSAPPLGAAAAPGAQQPQQPQQQLQQQQQAAAAGAGGGAQGGPTGGTVVATVNGSVLWTEHTAPDNRKYYYNHKTKESVWEKPSELLAGQV